MGRHRGSRWWVVLGRRSGGCPRHSSAVPVVVEVAEAVPPLPVLSTADTWAYAIQGLRASAGVRSGESHGQMVAANAAVEAAWAGLSDAEVREVASALALLPRFTRVSLTDRVELDQMQVDFAWAYS